MAGTMIVAYSPGEMKLGDELVQVEAPSWHTAWGQLPAGQADDSREFPDLVSALAYASGLGVDGILVQYLGVEFPATAAA